MLFTLQQLSHKFDVPESTLRFVMGREGLLVDGPPVLAYSEDVLELLGEGLLHTRQQKIEIRKARLRG